MKAVTDRITIVLKTLLRLVTQEWPLWLTMVMTLVPVSWHHVDYHVRWMHDLPLGLVLSTLNSMCVVAVVATVVTAAVAALPRRRVVKWVLYALLLALWLVSVFLWKNFNTTYTPQVLQLLLETNRGESSEFLQAWIGAAGTRCALQMVALTLVLVLLAEWRRRPVAAWLSRRVPTGVTAVLLAVIVGWGMYQGHKLVMPCHSLYDLEMMEARYRSNDVFSTLHSSVLTLKFQRQETDKAIGLALQAATSGTVICQADSMDLVLVIGESYNKRRSSLYGYSLDTSPLMRAERDRGLLTVFTDAIAPYNLTSVTIKNMLSLNSMGHGEQWHERPMWPAVMRRAGWQVDVWDNQRDFMAGELFTLSLNSYLFSPSIVSAVYHAVNDTTYLMDGDLVSDYFSKWRPAARNLVIFHLMGQHTAYNARYPHTAQWQVWSPADVPDATAPYIDEERRQVMLDYARATRYNDYVLAAILDHYRSRNAVVVMLSDHGEEVYDYRDFMERDHDSHKTPQMVRYENEIPLLVWCSPIYLQRHPDRARALTAAASRPLTSDDLGQMMLWLGQTRCQWSDSTRNVLHPSYSPGPRIIYDGLDYDRLMR